MEATTEKKQDGRDLGYYGVFFAADSDHLAGYIYLSEPPDGNTLHASEVISILQKELGLQEIITEEVENIISAWNGGERYEDRAIVVAGIIPNHGTDGSIEWTEDFFSNTRGIDDIIDETSNDADCVAESESEDEDEEDKGVDLRVDFYTISHVKVVRQGEVLGIIHPPTEGSKGKDIFGNEIIAKDGKPAHVKVGKNVEVTEDETNIIAACDGQIAVIDSKLHVKPILEIDGDVDYDVGKIDFPGTVIIKGNVQDGFSVKAGQELYVNGLVEAATIESPGDMFLKGGASGKSKGKIICGGNLLAKHLDNIHVDAVGALEVKSEIMNCTIYTKSIVQVPQGAIVGGEIHSTKGGEAGVLGSDAATNLKLFIGHDFEAEKQIEKINEETKDIAEKMHDIAKFLKEQMYLLQGRGAKQEGAGKIKEGIVNKQAELTSLKERADKIDEIKTGLWEKVKEAKHGATFIIRKHIYPGVMIDIGGERKSWDTEYTHGVKVTLNLKTYEIEMIGI